MTNAEKYLKDGVSADKFIEDMFSSHYTEEIDRVLYLNRGSIDYWLKTTIKPTLTEDERVILRNLRDKYKYIGREGMLYIAEQERNSNFVSQVVIDEYKFGLFQFIKERRRI